MGQGVVAIEAPAVGRIIICTRQVRHRAVGVAEDEGVDPSLVQAVGDAVITGLNDKDRAVRSAAIEALGLMRYERGLQALTDLFKYYGSGDLAEVTLDAIAHIGHPASVPLLTSQLASKSATMKMLAIEGAYVNPTPSLFDDVPVRQARH